MTYWKKQFFWGGSKRDLLAQNICTKKRAGQQALSFLPVSLQRYEPDSWMGKIRYLSALKVRVESSKVHYLHPEDWQRSPSALFLKNHLVAFSTHPRQSPRPRGRRYSPDEASSLMTKALMINSISRKLLTWLKRKCSLGNRDGSSGVSYSGFGIRFLQVQKVFFHLTITI